MNLNEIDENLKAISGNEKALLKLIDIKIDSDMEKVLNKMDAFNTELKRVEDNMNTKFNMIIWAIGIMIALIVALKVFS
jgi:translation elongation factor EF-G